MRDDFVLEGSIPPGGIVELLAEIEATCTTGVLRYESTPNETGTITLVRGQFAQEQALDDAGRDPVEVLLLLREGHFFVQQQLPPLPVSTGDHLVKTGSLAVHIPSELMRYCERSGLTGLLELVCPPHLAELFYERGELTEVRMGPGGIELQDLFGWESGHFTIEAHREAVPSLLPPRAASAADTWPNADTELLPHAEPENPSRPDSVEPPSFLRVVEMSLAELLQECSAHSPVVRSGPVIPQLPPVRPSQRPPSALPLGIPSKPARVDSTVRVIYLATERAPSDDDRRPAMDLNVPLPGEGRVSPKPDLPRSAAISALDDAGRLRQSQWPEKLADLARDDERTTPFETASRAAIDVARLGTMLADSNELDNDLPTVPPPGRLSAMNNTNHSDNAAPAAHAHANPPADAKTTAKWVVLTCLVLVACLAVLARLPPIE